MRWILFILCFFTYPVWGDNIDVEESEEQIPSKNASNVHGLVDIVFKNDYITPRGLLVTDTGLTIQVLNNLVLELTKSVFLNFGAWHDIWTAQGNPYVGAWNEFDWFAGISFVFQKLKFQAQFIEFVSPPHNFTPENNAEFIVFYEAWRINPYFKFFYAISGDSTVVVGKPGGTYYFELGMIPTFEFKEVIFTFPTWISFGPESFWNGGKLAIKHSHSNFGVLTSGIHAKVPLRCIAEKFGAWYAGLGFQYYYLINDNLLQAQVFTIGAQSLGSAHRSIGVGSMNIGFEF